MIQYILPAHRESRKPDLVLLYRLQNKDNEALSRPQKRQKVMQTEAMKPSIPITRGTPSTAQDPTINTSDTINLPVKAPTSHNLAGLINNAATNEQALEQKFARFKEMRNRKRDRGY